MDNGIWITWYDLPEAGREEYFSWLHGTYIPELSKRPGYLWAAHYAAVEKGERRTNNRDVRKICDDPSVPTGDRYILLVGGENAQVFGNPLPKALHAELPAEGRKMHAMRQGERMNIMAESGRVEGPEAKEYKGGMALGPCIQVGNYSCSWQHEDELLAFYAKWRLPAMGRTPGCIRIRSLASVSGWAKLGVVYEFVSLEARNQHFISHEDGHPEVIAWGDRVTRGLTHAPGSSSLACRIWPAVTN